MSEGEATITEHFREASLNNRILAGEVQEIDIPVSRPGETVTRYHARGPGVIVFERWEGNQFGTQLSEIYAFRPSTKYKATIPGVQGNVEILMYLRTWKYVKRFFPVLDQIRDTGLWAMIPATWWPPA